MRKYNFTPTEEQRQLVALLVGYGTPLPVIARFIKAEGQEMHVSVATLQRHFKPEIEDGRELSNGLLLGRAFKMAMEGDTTMMIFLLKCRAGLKPPADELHVHQTYAALVEQADAKFRERPALAIIEGGKAVNE